MRVLLIDNYDRCWAKLQQLTSTEKIENLTAIHLSLCAATRIICSISSRTQQGVRVPPSSCLYREALSRDFPLSGDCVQGLFIAELRLPLFWRPSCRTAGGHLQR